MKFECIEIGLKVEVEKELLDKMYIEAMKHYPAEFGGFLIGKYADDRKTCIINDIILPEKYIASKYYFERGVEGVIEKLEEYYNRKPSLIYIGEWHTHPDMEAEPSGTDKKAMKEIAEYEDVTIRNPLLLIISNTKKGYTFNFFVQYNNSILKYGK